MDPSPTSTRRARAAQLTAAALLTGVAAIHIALAFVYPFPLLQILFLASAVGTSTAAGLLVAGASIAGWLLGGGTALLTAIGYVLRSTVGIPGLLPAPFPFLSPPIGPLSVVLELSVVVLAALALTRRPRPTAAAALAQLRRVTGRSS